MALTRADLAEKLILKYKFSKLHAQCFVDNFFEAIIKCLERGETVKLTGFGNFELRDKASRPGRNPKTGEEVIIAPRRVATFKAGQKLKTRVSSND